MCQIKSIRTKKAEFPMRELAKNFEASQTTLAGDHK